MRHTVFVVCWLLIAAISAYDAYLTALYSHVIDEQNPIAYRMIQKGGVPMVIGIKFFGTTVVLAALLGFYQRGRHAFSILAGVTFFQLLLLFYLVLA